MMRRGSTKSLGSPRGLLVDDDVDCRGDAACYHEERGLIAPVGRRGLRRQLDERVLELALIALGRSAGFSLDELAGVFAPDGRPRLDRQMLAARAQELERKTRELRKLRDGLRRRVPRTQPHGMQHVPPPARCGGGRPGARAAPQAGASAAEGVGRLRAFLA